MKWVNAAFSKVDKAEHLLAATLQYFEVGLQLSTSGHTFEYMAYINNLTTLCQILNQPSLLL